MSQVSFEGHAAASLRDVTGPLVLVGAGKMGSALLEGWLRLGLEPTSRLSCQAILKRENVTVEIPKYSINHAKEKH